jgi:simple sugar transport system ATP-binding protein
MTLLVQMRGIVKRFPGVLANDHIDLDVQAGEIHALLGENGAGKTTLMKILAGVYHPDEGEILWKGEPRRFSSPLEAIECGISMVHQHFTLIPTLSVAENVMLGRRSQREPFFDARAAERLVAEIADSLGVQIDPRIKVWRLPTGLRQWVEIIRALSREPALLILDEPTSVLTPREADGLFRAITRLAQEGQAICFITHKLDEVMAVSSTITVLRAGQVVGTVETLGASQRELARMMVGRELTPVTRSGTGQPGRAVLRLENVEAIGERHQRALKGVSLELRSGEILGIAAVAGNGQNELAEVIAGLRPVSRGHVYLGGDELSNCSPRQVCRAGLAYIPDRPWQTAIFADFSLEDNLILKSHRSTPLVSRGVLQRQEIEQYANRLLKEFDVRAVSSRTPAGKLSGGNLQKMVLARELARDPRVIIAVNPTAGLDVGATADIRVRLLAERNRGRAILLISADLDEVLALSDRIAVMCSGEIVGLVDGKTANIEQVGLMMAGVACHLD